MDRRKFLLAGAAAGTTGLTVAGPAVAAACEDNLYNPPKPRTRLTYPPQAGEAPTPRHLQFPPGSPRRYYF